MAKRVGSAFLFYFERWRGSRAVQRMSFAQRGVYLEMLIEQWIRGSLPNDVSAIAEAICGSSDQMTEALENIDLVKKQFRRTDSRRHTIKNPALEVVRRAQQVWLEQKTRAAATRWEGSKTHATALRAHSGRTAVAHRAHSGRNPIDR